MHGGNRTVGRKKGGLRCSPSGGPVARDRAFFFFNYEEERQPGTSSFVRDVLTDPARRGDFSYVRQDNGQAATANLFDMTGIAPDPAIQSLVDSTPAPNDSSVGDGRNTAGYRFNSPDDSDARWLVFRGDYVMNPRHSVSGSFHHYRLDAPNSVFNDIDAVFPGRPGAGQGSRRNLASFGVTSAVGRNAVNEMRIGFQGYRAWFANNET